MEESKEESKEKPEEELSVREKLLALELQNLFDDDRPYLSSDDIRAE